MKIEKAKEKLLSIKKGTYAHVNYTRDLGNGVTKTTNMVIRYGVHKSNHTGQLAWGHWEQGLEGYVIEHKGNYYLRVTRTESDTHKPTSVYYLGNEQITYEQMVAICGEPKKNTSDVFNIKLENVTDIY